MIKKLLPMQYALPAINGVHDEKNIVATELYDYEVDPDETKNLVDVKNYSQVKKYLKDLLKGSFTSNRK